MAIGTFDSSYVTGLRPVASVRLFFNTWDGSAADSLGKVSSKLKLLVQNERAGYSAEAFVPVGNFVVRMRAEVDRDGLVMEYSEIFKHAICDVKLEEFPT